MKKPYRPVSTPQRQAIRETPAAVREEISREYRDLAVAMKATATKVENAGKPTLLSKWFHTSTS
jgi:hypothetical protein